MDTGRLRLGVAMLGSWARAKHEGAPGDGFAGTEHKLDIAWATWIFDAQLAIDPRVAFDIALPVRMTSIDATSTGPGGRDLSLDETIHRDQTAFGLGDLLLATRFGIVRPDDVKGWMLDLRLGANVPTGRAQPHPFHPDNPSGKERIALGSGTIDPVVGFDSNYNAGKWGFGAWTSARVPVLRNRWDIRSSRVVQAGAGPFTGFGLIKWRFLLQPEIYYASPVKWDDRDAPSTDRLSLLATVGVFVQPRPRFNVHALLKVPYYTRTKGLSFTWPFVALVGFNYTFELIPEREHHH